MTDELRRLDDGFSRRSLLKRGLIVGLGAAGLTAASSALTAEVAHATESTDSAKSGDGTLVAFTSQLDWYYCGNCRNLYYGPHNAVNGFCTATGSPHVRYSTPPLTNYGVPDQAPSPNRSSYGSGTFVQNPWRYCSRCTCLFYGPGQSTSWCPRLVAASGVNHDASGSGAYYLMNSTGSSAWTGGSQNVQPGWRYCANCKSMYWGGAWAGSDCQYQWSNGGPNKNNGSNGYGHAPGDTVYYLFIH
jgi:hypothetical protein